MRSIRERIKRTKTSLKYDYYKQYTYATISYRQNIHIVIVIEKVKNLVYVYVYIILRTTALFFRQF